MIRRDLGPNDLSSALGFLCQVNEHVNPNLFDRLFRKLKGDVSKQWGADLPRRIVMKIPSYAQKVLDVVQKTERGEISKSPLLLGLGHWLSRVVNAISAPTPEIESFAKVSRSVVANGVAEELEAPNSQLSFAEWDECGECDGLWKIQVGSSRVVRERLVTEKCQCNARMVQHLCLQNATGHVILRGCEQLRALLGDGLRTTLPAKARNGVYPSLESMMASMQSFACGLKTLTFPVFSVQDVRFVEP